jgi:integrator complex subunit 3
LGGCSRQQRLIELVYRFIQHLFQHQTVLKEMYMCLFYDWLFFTPEVDNIMNIGMQFYHLAFSDIMHEEPGILLMLHSMSKYPDITCACIDFLCRISKSYRPIELQPMIQKKIGLAFQRLVETRVVT